MRRQHPRVARDSRWLAAEPDARQPVAPPARGMGLRRQPGAVTRDPRRRQLELLKLRPSTRGFHSLAQGRPRPACARAGVLGWSCHRDFVLPHQQAVRPPGPLRRRVVPAQSRREGRPRRAQRRRQDDALPHDRRRGGADDGEVSVPKKADHRLLPPGRRGDVRALGARRGDRRQRPRRRPAPRARGAAARDGRSRSRRRDGQDPRALRRGAGGVRAPRRLRAREPGARGAARARLRRRADRRRRRRAVGRLEDARRDGAGAARPARRPADGRADEPPRHRVDHLARGVPQIAARARC